MGVFAARLRTAVAVLEEADRYVREQDMVPFLALKAALDDRSDLSEEDRTRLQEALVEYVSQVTRAGN